MIIYNYSVGDTVFVFVQIRMGVMMEVPTATKMQHVLMVSEVSPVSVTMGLLETVLHVLVSYRYSISSLIIRNSLCRYWWR